MSNNYCYILVAVMAVAALMAQAQAEVELARVTDDHCEDGVRCGDFCCRLGELCCYDSWSGTRFCHRDSCATGRQPEPEPKTENQCQGVQCGPFCCHRGQLCCYDSWSEAFFCDQHSCSISGN